MKEFSLRSKNYILVDVLKRAGIFIISQAQYPDNDLCLVNRKGGYSFIRTLPEGNYKIIGLTKDLTEAQCAEIVDSEYSRYFKCRVYKDYRRNIIIYESAKESFISLLQSLNIGDGLLIEKQ